MATLFRREDESSHSVEVHGQDLDRGVREGARSRVVGGDEKGSGLDVDVQRTLAEWLDIALWPGVSSDHRRDELRARARVRAADGAFTDPPRQTVRLVTVPREAVVDPDSVVRNENHHRLPVVTGSGWVDLMCDECGYAVCETIGSPQRYATLVFECPSCAAWQQVRPEAT